MKILFINPSLRPGNSAHLFLPVGLGYVVTYVKEHGYDFDILDVDAGNYTNDYIEKYFMKNKFINRVYGNSLIQRHKVINKNYTEDKDFYSISVSHNGYEKKFGYIHTRSIKILKKEDKIFGQDDLKKTKKYSIPLIYFIRFHIYPNTKIVKTKAGNSILISLSNGEGWSLQSKTSDFKIEKNIFLGNKNKIINNESVSISGNISEEIILIKWEIERVS